MTDATLLSSDYSNYAARAYAARPELASNVAQWAASPVTRQWIEARLDVHCAPCAEHGVLNEAALKTALRRLRTEVFCTVMEEPDLASAADVAEVTGAMTDLAEVAVQAGARGVVGGPRSAVFGEPRGPNGERLTLGIVGMRKLGGRELNASSDIDLIFVYEEDGETSGGTRSALTTQEFFTRLGKRLIGALAENTEDGCVFRVDMRLRPNSDSGPLVCSLGNFYMQGREWERYAWIKGWLVSETQSDSAQRLAKQLESIATPFIYRRYLDYGVIAAIRSLHQQIRQEARRRASMRPERPMTSSSAAAVSARSSSARKYSS